MSKIVISLVQLVKARFLSEVKKYVLLAPHSFRLLRTIERLSKHEQKCSYFSFKKQIQTEFIATEFHSNVNKGISLPHLFDIYYLYILVD